MGLLIMVSLHPSSVLLLSFYSSVKIPVINIFTKGILCLRNVMLGPVFLSCKTGSQKGSDSGLVGKGDCVPHRVTLIHIKKVRYIGISIKASFYCNILRSMLLTFQLDFAPVVLWGGCFNISKFSWLEGC